MNKNKELTMTSDLIKQVIDKIRKDEKENYQGLFSVSKYLANLYFSINTEEKEFEYFIYYKQTSLYVDILEWLGNEIDPKGHSKLNFKKLLNKYDEDIKKIKEKICELWTKNELENELKKYQKQIYAKPEESFIGMNRKYYREMIEDLLVLFPEYEAILVKEFKEEIRLC